MGLAQAGLRLLWISAGVRSPFPVPQAPAGQQTPRALARGRLAHCQSTPLVPRPSRSPIGGSSSAPTFSKPTRSAKKRRNRYLLFPPESGSGSDARGRWGQSWCRWGGEKLPPPPLPGAAEVKGETRHCLGWGLPWGARDLGTLLKHFPVETPVRSP